jgi:hypothetical protein
MVAVEQTSDQDWTQTAPLMAAHARSFAHSAHIAGESETQMVSPLVTPMAQKPSVCAHIPISPYDAAVMPAMH